MRQFRRLARIKLRTDAARTVPPAFTARMIRAHRECPWAERSDAAIVHRGDCAIRHGGGCNCVPEVYLTIDGQTIEVDEVGRVKRETRQ